MITLAESIGAKGWSLVRLEPSDYTLVRRFVLRVCRRLDDPDYFITSDMDTALADLLKVGVGLVYGAFHQGRLVAIQAIDFDALRKLSLRPSLCAALPRVGMESGWAIVSTKYRRLGIARQLALRLELDASRETGRSLVIATVHPSNVPSLGLYFGLGYRGVDLTEHFGVLRMVMMKSVRWPPANAHEGVAVCIPCSDVTQQRQLFERSYICVTVYNDRAVQSLGFVRPDLSIAEANISGAF